MVGDPWSKMAQKQKKQVDICDADYKSMVRNQTAKSLTNPQRLSRVVVDVNVHSVSERTCVTFESGQGNMLKVCDRIWRHGQM